MCALAGATLLVVGSYADTANNSFASVSGDGVVADGESGFCIENVEGSVNVTVGERPGWKCEKGTPFSYDHNEGDVDYFKFYGLDDEESVTIAISNIWVCVHDTTNNEEHVSAPGAEVPEPTHMLGAYFWPKEKGYKLHVSTNMTIVGTLGHHTNKVFAVPCPNPKCDYGKKENPIGGNDVEIDPSPVIAYLNSGNLQEDGSLLLECGEHTIGYTAHYTNDCKDCEFEVSFDYLRIDVCKVESTAEKYIGLDRTDAGYGKDHTITGAVSLTHAPGDVRYLWTVKPHCKIDGNDNEASVLAKVKRIAGEVPGGWDFEYSDSYEQEHLMCEVKLKDGCNPPCESGAGAENEFTIVKVDVEIDDVNELMEEKEGAYTYYVPDGDVPIWAEEWTNSLKDVSITCEPHDGEMSNQIVRLKFPEKHLYAKNKDGVYVEAKTEYTVEELNKTKFKLHGHKKSEKYKDKEIVAEHVVSHAIDKAQFTVFGRPWLVPDYDRKNNIDDKDVAKSKGGKTVFRFWVNDDDDYTSRWMNLYDFEWPMSFSYPGGINGHNRNVQKSGDNCTNGSVDGQNDLVDFTPFLINLSEVFFSKEPDDISRNVKWELKSDCVKVVWTKLSAEKAESFHTEKNDECGEKLNKASCKADSTSIKDWTSFSPAFAEYVDNNKGVVLVEGCAAAGTNSKFQIRGMLDGKVLTRGAVNLSISEVEDMFRWINLRSVTGDNGGKMTNTANPTNRPDDECDSKHFVFVHGYNVNEDSAIGWASEVFKRFWQAGVKAKFVGVDWNGDKSQLYFPLPYWGTVAPNYYVNVENAFNSAASLKTELDKLNGPKVVLGHSLGNVLVSSAICDKGLECKYYLLNAAVAGEAYNKNFYAHEMVRASWRDIPQKIWAANWYALDKFSEYEDDFRKEIFWRSRFVSLKNAISYYSTTEDVLTNPTTNGLGAAWSKQELFKGSPIKIFASGKCDAGWSIRGRYYKEVPGEDPWDTETLEPGSTTDRILNLPLIKSLTENDIIQQPVFEKFGKETEQMHKLEPMKIADTKDPEKLRAYFLGHSVPATSFATGSNAIGGVIGEERDYKTCEKGTEWPRDESEWRHSDIKNVAYYYISKFYKDIVDEN